MSSPLSRIFGGRGKPGTRPASPAPPPRPPGPQFRPDYSPADTSTWTFPHVSVASSNLASVAYDYPARMLEVRFLKAGARATGSCRYSDVPLVIYRDLMDSPSKGKYHRRHIRGRYPFHYV